MRKARCTGERAIHSSDPFQEVFQFGRSLQGMFIHGRSIFSRWKSFAVNGTRWPPLGKRLFPPLAQS